MQYTVTYITQNRKFYLLRTSQGRILDEIVDRISRSEHDGCTLSNQTVSNVLIYIN